MRVGRAVVFLSFLDHHIFPRRRRIQVLRGRKWEGGRHRHEDQDDDDQNCPLPHLAWEGVKGQ